MAIVHVAGGGLAGLVAARTLATDGHEVTLLEQAHEPGGRVASEQVDGFTLDRGFQVLFPSYPAVRRELDCAALDLQYYTAGATIARPGERTVLADPRQAPGKALETLLNTDITFGDKLGLARLVLSLSTTAPESLLDSSGRSIRDDLRRRGFSDRFIANFAAPFFGGVTLDRGLDTDSVVFDYVMRALVGDGAAVPAAGMGAIPAQLAAQARDAGVEIRTGVTVTDVSPDGDGVQLTTENATHHADAVVVATDPPTARELTGVEDIPTDGRGCVTCHVSLPSRSGLPTGNRLILNATTQGPNHVAPVSAVAPAQAPADQSLYSATFLGVPEADEDELLGRVQHALAEWYPEANLGDLSLVKTHRLPFAQFDQPPGFQSRLPAVTAPEGPVVLAGDYTRWSSIQGALESGRQAATAVTETL
jgi:phytoene dehydrogenase-like protein